jgi:hypothetical protein
MLCRCVLYVLYLRYWYKSGDTKVALAALDKEQTDAVQVRALRALLALLSSLALLVYKSGDTEQKDAVQVISCTCFTCFTCFTGTKVVLRLLAGLACKSRRTDAEGWCAGAAGQVACAST